MNEGCGSHEQRGAAADRGDRHARTGTAGDRSSKRSSDRRDNRSSNQSAAHCEPLLADCQLRAGTELFAHTWDPVVLAALSTGPRRRSHLLATSGGLSDKVLTDTLRRLLANGLIERRSLPAAPPRVDYALTALGSSLVEGPMRALARWTLDHADALLAAQEHTPG